ncbi:hypothetical protein ACWD5R_44735 [Streptomyces sp. NPDC002514]|uniref:hypothetical protein n=1 Tax=Streptomyces sp. NPDC001270 TaxID=3364554 RepID=UPI003682188C
MREPTSGTGRIDDIRHWCEEVWRAAKPLAGVVDLGELEYRLSDELWTCAQLIHQMVTLREVRYDTSAARKVLADQITGRRRQLEQLFGRVQSALRRRRGRPRRGVGCRP